MGRPDFLVVDQGLSNISNEMRENIDVSGIVLEEAPAESPVSTSNCGYVPRTV